MNAQVRSMIIGVFFVGGVMSSVSSGRAQTSGSAELLIDNSQAELTGTWTPSTYQASYYGANYVFRRSGTGANRIAWRPRLSANGQYAVYCHLPMGAADRAPDAALPCTMPRV